MIFHVLNRGNDREQNLDDESDYLAFEKVLLETQEQVFVRILSYCPMPNHWHLVLWSLHGGHCTGAIARWRPGAFYAAIDNHSCPSLASSSAHRWNGPSLPGNARLSPFSPRHGPLDRKTACNASRFPRSKSRQFRNSPRDVSDGLSVQRTMAGRKWTKSCVAW